MDDAQSKSASQSGTSRLRGLIATLKQSALIRNAAHLSVGQTIRLGTQAVYFVVVARALGPRSYGEFVAISAIAMIVYPFSGFGTNVLFVKNVKSGKRLANLCWGNGLLLILVTGSIFTAALVILNSLLHFKMPALALGCVCLGELVFARLADLAAFGFSAIDRMKQTAIQNSVLSLLRLAAILGLVVFLPRITLNEWVIACLLTSVIGSLYAVWETSKAWGAPTFNFSAMKQDLSEGFFFSVGESARSIYNDIDKTMLARLSDFGSTGIYGAAYRIIDVSMTPIRSLLTAAFPEMFRRGVDGMRATYPYAMSLIKRSGVAGLVLSGALILGAPLFSFVLGPKYAEVTPAIRWLALIPLLRCGHLFLADAFSGAGLQYVRVGIQLFVALLNIAANLIILPRWSWRGAAWTSVGCDAILLLFLWIAAQIFLRRQKPAHSISSRENGSWLGLTTKRIKRFATGQFLELYLKLFWKQLYKQGRAAQLAEPLVVSLTSYPPRFAKLSLTLRSILAQSIKPDQLILWIADGDFDKLPAEVLALQAYGLTIRTCQNLRSYKKIIPLLQEGNNCSVLIADDDVYYQRDWIQHFVSSYTPDSKTVLCGRAHWMAFDDHGEIEPYLSWLPVREHTSSPLIFPTGVGGVLYPPDIFHKDVTRVDLFNRYCPSADDIWLYWMASLNGAEFRKVGDTKEPQNWSGSQKVMLTRQNVQDGGNDAQIASMHRAYPHPALCVGLETTSQIDS